MQNSQTQGQMQNSIQKIYEWIIATRPTIDELREQGPVYAYAALILIKQGRIDIDDDDRLVPTP